MTDIFYGKLISGEEIIGKKVSDADGKMVLGDVRTLMMQQTGPGQMGLAMVPFISGAPESDIEIRDSDVMAIPVDGAPKGLEDAYLEQTSPLDLKTKF